MNRVRAHLIACAIAVLVCQGAALSAAPVALCRGALCRGALSADADLDECCKNLGPGQTCPMHHKTHGASDTRGPFDGAQGRPAWTCLCSPSDAVLASIAGVAGALPEPVRVPAAPVSVTTIIPVASSTLEHQQPPISPPPRASIRIVSRSQG
jgi:hypothetical protein